MEWEEECKLCAINTDQSCEWIIQGANLKSGDETILIRKWIIDEYLQIAL